MGRIIHVEECKVAKARRQTTQESSFLSLCTMDFFLSVQVNMRERKKTEIN